MPRQRGIGEPFHTESAERYQIALAEAAGLPAKGTPVLLLAQLLGDRSLIWRRHYREGAYVAG
jgi:hypothetical protein